jgi:membrane protease YdiL (CAAX protease family)
LVFPRQPGKDVRASMPTAPVELIISLFEVSLLLAGAFLVFRLLANSAARARWLGARALPPWSVTVAEFALFVLLIFGSGLVFQSGLHALLRDFILRAADWEALDLCVNGIGLDGGGLAGWLLFRSLQKTWQVDPDPAPAPVPRLPWSKVWLYGGGTLLMALPVIVVVNLGWTFGLKMLGLPDEPQELIAIFAHAKSPVVIATLLAVACGLAPLYEELLFRAGLYRFCRQKLGRNRALLVSGCVFGALHQNLAGFLPLSLFGIALALAYEVTGSIRVAVVAHGLFNLNTVFIVLSGLPQ